MPQKSKQIYKIKENKVQEYRDAKKKLDELETDFKNFRKQFIQDSNFRKKITHETALVEFLHPENCDEILQNYGKFQ